MTEYLKNSYADEDLKQIIAEIEGFEDEKISIRAKAAGECSQVQKKINNTKKRAKNLGIPDSSLSALLKVRGYERKIASVTETVNDEEVEIFEDMAGQFAFLKPETPGETTAQVAAREHKAAVQKKTDEELAEGEQVLDDLSKGTSVH